MRNKKGATLIFVGLLLVAAALFLTGYNLWDEARAERSARQAAERLAACVPALPSPVPENIPASEVEIPDYILDPEREMPTEEIDGQAYIGILRIPALGLELPVISQWSYPRLKLSPCRFSGSAYLDDLVIAAHNYPAHFGALNRLSPGDELTFTDMDGNVFRYAVAELETLAPTAVEEMTGGDYALTLFTCTVGGRSRLAVRCQRAEES